MSLAQSLLLDLEEEKEGFDQKESHETKNEKEQLLRPVNQLLIEKNNRTIIQHKLNDDQVKIDDDSIISGDQEIDQELQNDLNKLIKDTKIDKFIGKNIKDVDVPDLFDSKNLDEYRDFSEANTYISKINATLDRLHKKLVHIYSKRFPHLASLVPNPELYALTVKELRNEPSGVKFNDYLPKILSNSVIINMSLSQFTSPGQKLSDTEMEIINKLLESIELLNKKKMILLEFVELHLEKIAPNLTSLLGTSVATQLLSSVGGLQALVKIPSCDIHLIGSERIVTITGALSYSKRNGIVYNTDIVMNTSPEFIKRAVKLVCNKISIAARCDLYQENPAGSIGKKLRSDITDHLEKIQEPLWLSKDGAHDDIALPVPVEPPRRRRGGRRARKAKEILGMSEMRKQSNLMAFGKISEDITQIEIGKDYGKLGSMGSNRVRKSKIDVKTMSKISKKMQKNIKKENKTASQTFSHVGGNATVLRQQLQKSSGTASSVISFTPLQGLEIIVNSNNEQKKDSIKEDGYFSSLAQFKKKDAKNYTI